MFPDLKNYIYGLCIYLRTTEKKKKKRTKFFFWQKVVTIHNLQYDKHGRANFVACTQTDMTPLNLREYYVRRAVGEEGAVHAQNAT